MLNWSCAYASNMKRIKTSLNKAVRILSPDKGTKVAFQDQKILDFESFKKFNYSRFMWKVYNKELPSSIENIFLSHSSDREQRNRFPGKKFVSIYRTSYKERFLSNTAPVIWNELPENLKILTSFQLFSKKLHSFLLYEING